MNKRNQPAVSAVRPVIKRDQPVIIVVRR